MKKFNKIADDIFRTLLEAPLPPGIPTAGGAGGPPPPPPAGLPQDGGPVNAPAPDNTTAADRNPAELQNWETTLVNMAADAICRVQADPSVLDADDVKALSSGVNLKNKDDIIEIIKKLAGKI